MDSGFVKLWRCSIDSQVWNNDGLWKMWSWCLMKASHKERWVSVKTGRGETEILIKPGQFIFGRKVAAKELKAKPSTIRNRMGKLKSMRNVDIQPDTHYSIITICNWGSFQIDDNTKGQPRGQATDNQGTGKGQPKDTDKNVENVKNVKKTDCPADFPTTSDMLEYASSKKYYKNLEELTEGFLQHHRSKGNKFVCWYSAWQNWLRNDIKFNGAGDSKWQ